MSTDKKLTSVRVDKDTFLKFRQECLKDKYSFQKLANRCIYLYLNDNDFKNRILKGKNE